MMVRRPRLSDTGSRRGPRPLTLAEYRRNASGHERSLCSYRIGRSPASFPIARGRRCGATSVKGKQRTAPLETGLRVHRFVPAAEVLRVRPAEPTRNAREQALDPARRPPAASIAQRRLLSATRAPPILGSSPNMNLDTSTSADQHSARGSNPRPPPCKTRSERRRSSRPNHLLVFRAAVDGHGPCRPAVDVP